MPDWMPGSLLLIGGIVLCLIGGALSLFFATMPNVAHGPNEIPAKLVVLVLAGITSFAGGLLVIVGAIRWAMAPSIFYQARLYRLLRRMNADRKGPDIDDHGQINE